VVRRYVTLGLVKPSTDAFGSNRYQHFYEHDVNRAALIRIGQHLGFTLKEIVAVNREYEAGGMDRIRRLAVMQAQLPKFKLLCTPKSHGSKKAKAAPSPRLAGCKP
jgi:DNA-binding transcriptional MerR regulator